MRAALRQTGLGRLALSAVAARVLLACSTGGADAIR
ncbi:hypothetical protein DT23_02070 [Thioclava indica]|uniref:Uncharacterized protein n=1 Tax=Thioclava indica TaxID=1353528 RepID=A0A074JZ73_9RHOB|nr:hypothetical protein DT23_02070 [Thioclava indica]